MTHISWTTLSHKPCAQLAQKPWKRANHALPSHYIHQHFSKSACRYFIYLTTFLGVVLSKKQLIPIILNTKKRVGPFFSPGRSGTTAPHGKQWDMHYLTDVTLFLLLTSPSRFLLPHPFITLSLLHPTLLPQLLFLLLPSTLHTSTCFTTPVSFSFSAGHSYT